MYSTIDHIEQLLTSYQEVKGQFQQERIDEVIPVIDELLFEYGIMKEEYYKWNAVNSERYNIFDILNIRFGETKTHTPFLVNLLNPKGSHGQGIMFFKLFMDNVAPQDKMYLFKEVKPSNIYIKEEKSTQDGRLDIYIESVGLENKFAVVIENKINAGDQDDQLLRYYTHCERAGFSDENILIFYLTKDGKIASDKSLHEVDRNKLIEASVLVNISYRSDIKKILKTYIENIKSEKVKIVTQQYLNIIKAF